MEFAWIIIAIAWVVRVRQIARRDRICEARTRLGNLPLHVSGPYSAKHWRR